MYKLFTKLDIIEIVLETSNQRIDFSNKECFFLQDDLFVTIIVPKFYDPQLWLFKPFQNVIVYQHKNDCDNDSLELFINRLNKIEKYYVVGENPIILLLDQNENEMITIHLSTIDMLLERSIYCNRPFILELENKN